MCLSTEREINIESLGKVVQYFNLNFIITNDFPFILGNSGEPQECSLLNLEIKVKLSDYREK